MVSDELITRLMEELQCRFYGKYRGKVTDNDDPLHRGRIRAKVPKVLGDTESGWCTACVPYAGSDKGWFVIPEVDDAVWIEFEAGDPSHPIWSGAWFGDDERPADPDGIQATSQIKILKSASGLMVDLDDSGHEIKVSDKDGSNLVNIKVDDGKIVIQAKTNVTIEAPQINLVDSSTHPVVFGDDLLQYLNQVAQVFQAHTHPGQVAAGVLPVAPTPPVVPFPQATSSLLSTKVMTG